ncbi:hypothetical protein [Marinobacterium rhizophilum]|uniref:Uncharacterized protein n=1 Tax=Marinobacterium rhizophilum TaxID=420402 RepID=A0ABY5HJY3_9GAMM|nr:hypothetical protein [Marinobacterium rhizophilum]UTW11584.1 hypothetical protein KDW95_20415 [Marinobacterium rhizophilum]
MTDPRHPDIEIYVKNCSLEQLEEWITRHCTGLEKRFNQGLIYEYSCTMNAAPVEVMIHQKVVGKAWTSIWFKSDRTPWAKDLDCALDAFAALATEVRCIAAGWSNGQDPDEWWQIATGQPEKIQWRTE